DDGQLDLVVGLDAAARHEHLVVRADHGVARLHEHDGLGGHLGAGLGGVVAVVQADAHHLAGPGDRGADAYALGIDDRKCAALQGLPDPRHSPGGEERPVDVGLPDVTEVALAIHHHWSFLAGRSYPQQLHTASFGYTSDV